MPAIEDLFGKVSIDTDHSVATTVSADRTAGVTVLACFDLSTFTEDTPVYFITYTKTTDPLTSEVTITDTVSWKGLVNAGANTITNLEVAPGYVDGGNTDGQFVECIPTSYWANSLIDGIQEQHNPDGTHSDITATTVTADEFIVTGTAGANNGWTVGLPTPDTVTNNGNRSYDLVFNSTDLTDTVSEGMRLRTTRTVSAPTYMGGLMNGSSHYFTKTTCTSTLSTVTNNFTLMGWAEPTAYAANSFIMGRTDATQSTGFFLRVNASGQIELGVFNGGVGNYRFVSSYQSISLNKKTHVAASWASGTVVIYLDGVSVPVGTATTAGTAPTAASAAAADFSVGRQGPIVTTFFPGYLSGIGVFDAVLSAATIRSYSSQVLSGSETNCIGAWSLNNTGVNQQAPGTNDLTATGGVSYTLRSPYGNYLGGTLDYAIITKTAFSTNTTLTVQVPEGCAIPTSGGVSAVAYSTQAVPYGFPRDSGKWKLETLSRTLLQYTGPVAGTWYNSLKITTPVGAWKLGFNAAPQGNRTAGVLGLRVTLSTANNTSGAKELTASLDFNAITDAGVTMTKEGYVLATSAVDYFLNISANASGLSNIYLTGDRSTTIIYLEPAYL